MSKKKKKINQVTKRGKTWRTFLHDYYHKKGYTRDSYWKFHGKLVDWKLKHQQKPKGMVTEKAN